MKYQIAAATAALTIAACGGTTATEFAGTTAAPETTAAPTTTTTTTTAPRTTRPTVPVNTEPPMNGYQPDVYLEALRDFVPDWYYSYTDENLINLALLSCENLDSGMAIDRLLFELMVMVDEVDPSLNDSIGVWLRAVVRYVCPEYFYQIENL
jgi:hypothetical protein